MSNGNKISAEGCKERRGIAVIIPYPPKCLFPNAEQRTHWGTIGRAKKAQRAYAWGRALEALGGKPKPNWTRAISLLTVFKPNRRAMPDPSGIIGAVKAAHDGIADAGIMENDRGLQHGPVSFIIDPTRKAEIEILIEPIGESE